MGCIGLNTCLCRSSASELKRNNKEWCKCVCFNEIYRWLHLNKFQSFAGTSYFQIYSISTSIYIYILWSLLFIEVVFFLTCSWIRLLRSSWAFLSRVAGLWNISFWNSNDLSSRVISVGPWRRNLCGPAAWKAIWSSYHMRADGYSCFNFCRCEWYV